MAPDLPYDLKIASGMTFLGLTIAGRIVSEIRGRELEAGSMQWKMRAYHVNAVESAGGYAARLAAIAYLSWRLHYTSDAIVDVTRGEVSRRAIRINLYRMVMRAKALGFETFLPHPRRSGFGRKYAGRNGPVCFVDPSTVPQRLLTQDPDYLRYVSFCERVGSPAMSEEHWQHTR